MCNRASIQLPQIKTNNTGLLLSPHLVATSSYKRLGPHKAMFMKPKSIRAGHRRTAYKPTATQNVILPPIESEMFIENSILVHEVHLNTEHIHRIR